MTNISGPDFITLLVSDLGASYNFYKEKIGLSESSEKRPNAHAFATRPCGLAIRQSPDRRKIDNPGQGIIIWLLTSDATALHNDLGPSLHLGQICFEEIFLIVLGDINRW
jgi:hypothetical protein